MTFDLANITKADVYAAAQDLGERLARQIEINQALRDENAALASRPCLECDTVTPVRIAALCELLAQAQSLIQAFPRHYTAASDTDSTASMIQHDRWQAFQDHCAKACTKIRNCLHGA
jgi:hypothetical protein